MSRDTVQNGLVLKSFLISYKFGLMQFLTRFITDLIRVIFKIKYISKGN